MLRYEKIIIIIVFMLFVICNEYFIRLMANNKEL